MIILFVHALISYCTRVTIISRKQSNREQWERKWFRKWWKSGDQTLGTATQHRADGEASPHVQEITLTVNS